MKKTLLLFLFLLCIIFTSCKMDEFQLMEDLPRESVLPAVDSSNKNNISQNIGFKKITFLGAGDNIVYEGTIYDAKKKALPGGRKYNFKPIYSEVASLIENADISFINQETLMCGEGYANSGYPMFNGPQELGYDLSELGFDVVSIANNHMLDKGSAGLEKTIAFWKTLPVTLIGGYDNESDYNNIRVHETQGIKIAFLSYTYGTNGLSPSPKYDVHIPYLNEVNISEQVNMAKSKADLVFVSVHWGQEGQFKPNTEQKTYAKKFADAGVDVIIGHHPHVIQPVEWITGSGGNKTLCVYSLGNFMAEQAFAYNMVGGMISFDIVVIGDGKPKIENPVFIPTVFDFDKRTFLNNKVYLLENYTEEQAKNHGIGSYGRTTSLAQLRKYVSDTISDEFLPESYISSLK